MNKKKKNWAKKIIVGLLALSMALTAVGAAFAYQGSLEEVRIITDKEVYSPGEEIAIRVEAEGEGRLMFNTGCQATYRIGDFDLEEGRACTMAITYADLPESWDVTHDLERYPLDPGEHELEAGLLGYDKERITIRIEEEKEEDPWKEIKRILEEILNILRT